MRGKWLLLAGVALFLGAGLGALSLWQREQKPKTPVSTAPPEPPPGAEVQLDAQLRSQHVVDVAAPVEGTFVEAPVRPNDEVSEGQLLGRIQNQRLEEDQRENEAELETALSKKNALESSLLAARLEESRVSADASRARGEAQRLERIYTRQEVLMREGATPRLVFEKAEREYKTAKTDAETLEDVAKGLRTRIDELVKDGEAARLVVAEKEAVLEAAREALKAADIVSPVNGIVIAITKQPGDEIAKGLPDLFKIATDLLLLEAVAEAPPHVSKRIQVGQVAVVVIAELPGEGLPGTISEVKDGNVVVQFASPSPLIRPGMSALLRLKLP